jgi:phage terminase large subunit-like protein
LLHVLRRRMEYPELKRAVREQARAFGANVVLIQDKASGTQLIQELVQDGLHAVTRYQPQSGKIMRMQRRPRRSRTALSTSRKKRAGLPNMSMR